MLQTPWALLGFIVILHKKYILRSVLLLVLTCGLLEMRYTFPTSGSTVEGIFYIQSIQESARYGKGWSYVGMLHTARGQIPCRCFSKSYFSPSLTYKLKGSVRSTKVKLYALKIKGDWEQGHSRFSLCSWRFKAQKAVKSYIEKHVKQERSAHFLNGMITGQLDDRILMNEFSRLGLSHLMAISGLHFSLITFALHLALRFFLPSKVEAICLIVCLSFYLLFVGETPSVIRAWITIMVFLTGQLIERRSSAINALGVALCVSLILNPLSAVTLSFQLSFLATAGILFFYAPSEKMLNYWIPKRMLKDMVNKHRLVQHGYILSSLLRDALALTLSVHFAVLPLLALVFHTFSLNSILYNLFFPFLASLALLFFLACLLIGHWGHVLNGYYCDALLSIAETPPLFFKSYAIEDIPSWLIALIFIALLVTAIRMHTKRRTENSFFI